MSKEAILKIRETEEKAEAILADAKKEAKLRIDEARAKGLALREDAETRGSASLRRGQEELQKERNAALAASQKAAAKEAEELRAGAALKKKNAERIILGGLENKCR